MKLSHLKFVPCAVLMVLFCFPWVEVWTWGGCMPASVASASGVQMAFGAASPNDGGDVGIPEMDAENDRFLLSLASPRAWSVAGLGLVFPLAMVFALSAALTGKRRRQLQAASLSVLGGLGAWFCFVAARVPYFGLCPRTQQCEGLFPGTILGTSSGSGFGGAGFMKACFALEASCVVYALIAVTALALVLIYEQGGRDEAR